MHSPSDPSGIRTASGAQREQVLGLVLLDGLRPAFVGLLAGLASGAAVVLSIQAMFHDTKPLDAVVFVVVSAIPAARSWVRLPHPNLEGLATRPNASSEVRIRDSYETLCADPSHRRRNFRVADYSEVGIAKPRPRQ
jgi:hypothetical protein